MGTEIYKKLIKIQNELKAPKDQYNSFGKYNYRNCEDILEAVKPLLKTENLAILISDEIVSVGDRHYVRATITLIDVETGETIQNSALAREEADKKGMDGSQITGASSSYARKYALNGLFAIDDTADSDKTNTGEKKEVDVKNEVKLITEFQKKRLIELGSNLTAMAKYYKVESVDEITEAQAKDAIIRKEAANKKKEEEVENG